MASRVHTIGWRYWLAMAGLLASGLAGCPAAPLAAVALAAVQSAHFFLRAGRRPALPVQVRVIYLGLVLAGLWPPLAVIHWLLLAGTLALVAFDYCPLARTLALMPWNRAQLLTWRLVARAYLTPPVHGSILAVLAAPAQS
jgi:hypothetical protein